MERFLTCSRKKVGGRDRDRKIQPEDFLDLANPLTANVIQIEHPHEVLHADYCIDIVDTELTP